MMAFPTLFITLNVAIFIVAVSVAVFVLPFRKWGRAKWLLLFLTALCLISFNSLNVYIQKDFETQVLFSRLRFLGLSILAPSWLLFLSTSFQVWRWLQNRAAVVVLFAPAFFTILFSVLPPFQNLIITDFSALEILGLSIVTYKGGSWFPVHYISSIVITLLSFALGARVFLRGTDVQRKQIIVLMAGCFASLACDVYCVITNSPLRWAMLPAGTYLLTEGAIAYGVFQHRFLAAAVSDLQDVYVELPDAVFIIDEQEKIVSFNRAASWTFRVTDSMVGSLLTEIVHLPLKDKNDFEYVDRDGTNKIFECQVRPVSQSSDSLGKMIFLKDVTTQRENERKSVEEASFRARLMGLIAHDMYGHISSQTQLLESLQNDQVSQVLIDSSRSSQDLMGNLLTWAKSQEGVFQPSIQAFEINVLVEDVIEELSPLFSFKNVQLAFTPLAEPWVVQGDSQMIATVLRNLLTNALRASVAGQSVEISIDPQALFYGITVQDHGTGMSADQVCRLMNPAGEPSIAEADEKNGFGIGFTFVRQFVALHGGTVKVDSVLGQGTRISFSIPL